MSKSSKARVAKRIAAKTETETETKPVTRAAGKLEFDATRPLIVRSIAYGVAHATTVAAHALVEQLNLDLQAIAAKQATPSHARDLLNAIRKRIAEKRGIKWDAEKMAAPANKVSDYKKVLTLSTLGCWPKLIVTLRTIETLTIEHLYYVAAWLVGTRDVAAAWKAEASAPPTREQIEKAIARAVRRNTKNVDAAPTPVKRGHVTGMPTTDAVRSIDFVAKAAKKFRSLYGKSLTASEGKLLSAMIDNAASLQDAAKRIKAEANE